MSPNAIACRPHQNGSKTPSATPAIHSESRCQQVPRLQHIDVDVIKRPACHATWPLMSPGAMPTNLDVENFPFPKTCDQDSDRDCAHGSLGSRHTQAQEPLARKFTGKMPGTSYGPKTPGQTVRECAQSTCMCYEPLYMEI